MAFKLKLGRTPARDNHKKNRPIYLGIAALSILAFLGVLTMLGNFYHTQTYYVLKQNVNSRTQITPSMLKAETTTKAPVAAKNLSAVQSGSLYAKFPLLAGDILTDSNSGAYSDISTGIPDNWVVTSFSIPASSAVDGYIKRGMYFDVMVSQKSGSTYPFVNMLALDSSNSSTSTSAVTTSGNIQYIVGLSPANAAKLQQIFSSNAGNVHLVLSPEQNQYQAPNLSNYKGVFTYNDGSSNGGNADVPQNAGNGTDNTFSSVKRDAFGRPTNSGSTNCNSGNTQVTDSKLCAATGASSSN